MKKRGEEEGKIGGRAEEDRKIGGMDGGKAELGKGEGRAMEEEGEVAREEGGGRRVSP